MSKTCHNTGENETELIEVLSEISRVSARMARDLRILSAQRQSEEGGKSNVENNPYEKKLLGITAMTSLLGKSKFNEILGELTYKPQGKPTLVPESDKRPAMTNIIEDFEEEI